MSYKAQREHILLRTNDKHGEDREVSMEKCHLVPIRLQFTNLTFPLSGCDVVRRTVQATRGAKAQQAIRVNWYLASVRWFMRSTGYQVCVGFHTDCFSSMLRNSIASVPENSKEPPRTIDNLKISSIAGGLPFLDNYLL